jgi:hypothetical protein
VWVLVWALAGDAAVVRVVVWALVWVLVWALAGDAAVVRVVVWALVWGAVGGVVWGVSASVDDMVKTPSS